MRFEFRCLITGIGSLPFLDPKEACAYVAKYFKAIPFWPQLPRRSIKENMFNQFIEGFPGISQEGDKFIWKETGNLEEKLEVLYNRHLQGHHEGYGFGKDYASGLNAFLESNIMPDRAIKGQLTGPVSMGLGLVKEDMQSVIYDKTLSDALARYFCLKASWQEKALKALHKETIVFIDEPSLASIGSAFVNISKEQVTQLLGLVFQGLKGVKGIHCCGNTDWSLVLEITPDIVSFDAYNYMVNFGLYASEIKAFMERGGAVAWGIVPNTEEDLKKETAASLKDRLDEGLALLSRKGVNHHQLLVQSLLTPSCGLAGLSEDGAEKAAELLNQLSQILRKKYA